MRVTILDDYQGVARQIGNWDAGGLLAEVTAFGDHFAADAALAEQLHDSEIVVAMRERRAFIRSLCAAAIPDVCDAQSGACSCYVWRPRQHWGGAGARERGGLCHPERGFRQIGEGETVCRGWRRGDVNRHDRSASGTALRGFCGVRQG